MLQPAAKVLIESRHVIRCLDSRSVDALPDESVHLVVTSPPYPMIEMWDRMFGEISDEARNHLEAGRGPEAFEAMHRVLDDVWASCFRWLVPGGFLCINIGDAVRTLNGRFALYPNHARVLISCQRLGFTPLSGILWRKPTNAPNKFMGSGMLPAGAYVTLEHEHILILRKGGKRSFSSSNERLRRSWSALFWEERNAFFSDLWELAGTRQFNGSGRERSAAFPLEVPFRLVSMYSCIGDTVLDPFVGTGTTSLASLAQARSSIGLEILPELCEEAEARLLRGTKEANARVRARLESHADFVRESKKRCLYRNPFLGMPVTTRQECGIRIFEVARVYRSREGVQAEYSPVPGIATQERLL